ncbi:MAG: [citrate (pro-3S)-lyase] ligase [Tissierella sp.]|nr:[citrate (pro-3S)-lyase] ligase [Tissierella sp.]
MYKRDINIRTINLGRNSEKQKIIMFLKDHDLLFEEDIDYTIGVYQEDSLIGTGSLSGNVLKCIAVNGEFQGEGIFNKIISQLINTQYQRGNMHLFVFTGPENKKFFEDTGFREISSVDDKVSLLENDPKGIEKYVENLKRSKKEGAIISSIVMNCNPFTLGHQYLIEKAAKSSDIVHIFLVWEDRSLFPNDIRLKLLREGTSHLDNVIIHKGENYIISNSTFPSYFLKEENTVVKTHATLDIKLFVEYICPVLGINKRFVGREPNDPVTNEYNKAIMKLLPIYNIQVEEIPRLTVGEGVISATKVRKSIKEGNMESLKQLVPMTTYKYIVSDDAKPVIDKIRKDM